MKASWQTKKLEEILDKVTYTEKVQKNQFLESGKFPIISQEESFINGYWNNTKNVFKIRKPVVIFGDHTQVLKYVDFDFVLGADGVKILQPKPFLDTKYFYYFLQGVTLKKLGYARHYRLLKKIEITYPDSLAQQKRIVKILDDVFEKTTKARENTEKNLQNSHEIFESYLQGVFTNPGKDWDKKTLKEVAEIKPPKKEARKKLNETDFVSFVPMEDLGINQKEFIPSKERKLKEVEGSYTYFANEDVLLAKITPCFENGKIGIARNLKNKIGFGSSEYIVFRANDKIIPDLLFYFLSREQFRTEGEKRMSGAVGHKRVSKEFIEDYVMPFPTSIVEQKVIVKKLDALAENTKKLENNYEHRLADLDELKKSVLNKTFTQQL